MNFRSLGYKKAEVEEGGANFGMGATSFSASTASAKGIGGTVLWVHSSLISTHSYCSVLHPDPRLLVMRLRFAGSLVQCVVLRALPLSTNRSEGLLGGTETTSTLQRVLKREIPTIFLTDSNAHLGSTLSPVVGSVVGERACEGGSMFHALLSEFQVMLPSTFLGGGPPWRSTAGHFYRIDFVGVPRRMVSRRWKCHRTYQNCSSPSRRSRSHPRWSCCGSQKQWVARSRRAHWRTQFCVRKCPPHSSVQ